MPFLGPLVAGLGAMLSRLVFSKAGPWVVGAFVFLGIELATVGALLPIVRDRVLSAMGGIPADIAAWMGVFKLDVYVTVILSAYAAGAAKKAVLRRRTA